MSEYKLHDDVWVLFRNGDKVGWVPASGWIVAKIIGNAAAYPGEKQYAVEVAPGISGAYDEHEIFATKEGLFEHLSRNVVDR